ncbi:MAG TPA: hypothetical protein VMF31_13540 [Solirubrobacterales bacterium]|nr:hypothetical protein [Solirubrobacterales bacterium]
MSRTDPGDALRTLRERIALEGEPLSGHLTESLDRPAFGELAAAGPRTSAAPSEYAFVVEAVREGYLCHYGTSRLLSGPDPDLALLAGDLFYAIGINGLSRLDDPESVGILSDLIRVAAELRAEDETEMAEALWLAQLLALACGSSPELSGLIAAVERRENRSLEGLKEWSENTAETNGLGRAFLVAHNAIDFRPTNL